MYQKGKMGPTPGNRQKLRLQYHNRVAGGDNFNFPRSFFCAIFTG